ncbi:hypothetical protein A3D77_04650 [Candidatus Gottesmanbacteria bacterium RIFCSPHIGHO2_02_FULL_39_11]|uniref:Glycosyltransferase 2-like domain-containing protein n=1 Tax=Candidatus Gottesmanbacteria bacterium RIFCSPHIGHO2_02_FULL_39_11 TaxID=1798382 RepID=A0A1F5ZJD9_9BACT|nr:MAG: hypothetical protein A3D77_04650 [Candidatus Gottesmanbacteria bacterium RIFCSPHIGHO2_02_FULL_39_11]
MITAIVLTKNEEGSIEKCLKSLAWCDEIIIMDDYSTDATLTIAQKYTKNIYKRGVNGDYSSQRNYALRYAKNNWVLFIDADEWVGNNLRKEIQSSLKITKNVNGFYFKRRDYFLGKWLNYGETSYVKLLRLGEKDSGKWKGKVHEVWDIEGITQNFSNPLFHHSHESVEEFLEKINYYSDISSYEKIQNGIKVSKVNIIFYPAGKFVQNYLFRRGFLDGIQGLILALMMSFHSFLVRSKTYI